MENQGEKEWYVVQSKPRQEALARDSLAALGLEVYLPLYLKDEKRHRVKVKILSPLFAGYLFARFDTDTHYRAVRYARGVKTLLGQGHRLLSIPDSRIRDIREREKDGVVSLQKKTRPFNSGDPIRIDEGDFDGWRGIFVEELSDQERAVILLTSLSYSSRMVVPKNILIHDRS